MIVQQHIITDDTAHAVPFWGFSLSETAGSASVTVTFKDGVTGGAILLPPFIIPAGGNVTVFFPGQVAVEDASDSVYVDVTGTGTLSGVLFEGIE